jgi:hypothetical protein
MLCNVTPLFTLWVYEEDTRLNGCVVWKFAVKILCCTLNIFACCAVVNAVGIELYGFAEFKF